MTISLSPRKRGRGFGVRDPHAHRDYAGGPRGCLARARPRRRRAAPIADDIFARIAARSEGGGCTARASMLRVDVPRGRPALRTSIRRRRGASPRRSRWARAGLRSVRCRLVVGARGRVRHGPWRACRAGPPRRRRSLLPASPSSPRAQAELTTAERGAAINRLRSSTTFRAPPPPPHDRGRGPLRRGKRAELSRSPRNVLRVLVGAPIGGGAGGPAAAEIRGASRPNLDDMSPELVGAARPKPCSPAGAVRRVCRRPIVMKKGPASARGHGPSRRRLPLAEVQARLLPALDDAGPCASRPMARAVPPAARVRRRVGRRTGQVRVPRSVPLEGEVLGVKPGVSRELQAASRAARRGSPCAPCLAAATAAGGTALLARLRRRASAAEGETGEGAMSELFAPPRIRGGSVEGRTGPGPSARAREPAFHAAARARRPRAPRRPSVSGAPRSSRIPDAGVHRPPDKRRRARFGADQAAARAVPRTSRRRPPSRTGEGDVFTSIRERSQSGRVPASSWAEKPIGRASSPPPFYPRDGRRRFERPFRRGFYPRGGGASAAVALRHDPARRPRPSRPIPRRRTRPASPRRTSRPRRRLRAIEKYRGLHRQRLRRHRRSSTARAASST